MTRTSSNIVAWKKGLAHLLRTQKSRVKTIEADVKTFAPLTNPEIIQEITYQFQSTSFTQSQAAGDARVYSNTAPSTIDEETNAAVAAYATFNDVGGNGTALASTFDVTMHRVPLLDNEGRTAYYHGHWKHIRWDPHKHPEVQHERQFMMAHSIELNVPGTAAIDQEAFIYYESHANFNISANTSVSLWFYPTDLTRIGTETWRILFYRRIDASNYYVILIKPTDSKVYVFVQEAGATTKLVSSGTVNVNAWNLIIFSYNPTTNALVMYLNNSSASTTPADNFTPPYTADAHMYIGGLPNLPAKRFTGNLDNFVFWTGKILTGTEAGNMWNHGTII